MLLLVVVVQYNTVTWKCYLDTITLSNQYATHDRAIVDAFRNLSFYLKVTDTCHNNYNSMASLGSL